MDLSLIEGLTEAQITAIQAVHETDVTGLKSKNTELLGKMDSYKGELNAGEQALEEARKANVELEKAQLVQAGKYDEALKLEREENSKTTAALQLSTEVANNALKQRDLGEFHAEMMLSIHDDPIKQIAAKSIIEKNSSVTYDEQGNKTLCMKVGDKQFNNTADFLMHAETDATWKAMLKAPDTQGIEVHNSNAQGGGNYEKADMSGTKAQKVAAAVAANPKLKDLPLR